jgi:SPP1 gp7 family putative phage head morphogenesis protein
MPSDLDKVIREQRKRLNDLDAEARSRMRAAYERSVERIEREIDDVVRALEAYPGSEWRLYHERRLRTLLSLAEVEYARFADTAGTVLRSEQVRAVSGGAHAAQEMAAASGMNVGFGVALNTPALERLASSFAPGSPLRGVLDSYGDFGRKVIERELTDALIGGKSPREASRDIRRTLGSKGVKARIDTTARTELLRSFRGSLFETFDQIGVTHWRWSASLSARSCLACIAKSGTTYPMSQPFMPSHPNCRCVPSPVAPSVTVESGEAWFARQSPDVQRRMMPSQEALAAYHDGRIKLSDFVGHRRDRVWGPSVYERSGREVLRRHG